MRVFKDLPKLDYLFECFDLDENGIFRWKARPASHFKAPWVEVRFKKLYSGVIAGNPDTRGHLSLFIDGKSYMAHRIAFYMYNGFIDNTLEVDHINEIKIDNSKLNLRQATHGQNRANIKFNKNSSGLKGVYWNEPTKNWRAACCKDGRLHYIGLYDDKFQAFEAVKRKRIELHGEFANHGHGSILLKKE